MLPSHSAHLADRFEIQARKLSHVVWPNFAVLRWFALGAKRMCIEDLQDRQTILGVEVVNPFDGGKRSR